VVYADATEDIKTIIKADYALAKKNYIMSLPIEGVTSVNADCNSINLVYNSVPREPFRVNNLHRLLDPSTGEYYLAYLTEFDMSNLNVVKKTSIDAHYLVEVDDTTLRVKGNERFLR
jgi:hypothetical protein